MWIIESLGQGLMRSFDQTFVDLGAVPTNKSSTKIWLEITQTELGK